MIVRRSPWARRDKISRHLRHTTLHVLWHHMNCARTVKLTQQSCIDGVHVQERGLYPPVGTGMQVDARAHRRSQQQSNSFFITKDDRRRYHTQYAHAYTQVHTYRAGSCPKQTSNMRENSNTKQSSKSESKTIWRITPARLNAALLFRAR